MPVARSGWCRSARRTRVRPSRSRSASPDASGTPGSRSIGRGLAKVEVLTIDTLIAFAAKAGSTAEDGRGSNSPYTTALVKHLATPGLDVRLAFGRVRDEVLRSTKGKQEPVYYGSLGGREIALVPAAPTLPPSVV